MMKMPGFLRWLLDHRLAAFAALGLVTALCGWQASTLRVDPGAEAMIPSGPDVELLRELNAVFGSDEVILLAAHDPELFTRENLARLDELRKKAERLPHVARVLSPTNARDVDGDALGPFPAVPYEQMLEGEISPDELGRRLAGHPLYGGLIVAPDATTAALVIEVERSETMDDYRANLVRAVRSLAGEAPAGWTVHVAGIPVEKVDVAAYVGRDQAIFVPLIFLALVVVTASFYRHPSVVLVSMSVVVVSLIWTMGLFATAGQALNPLTSLTSPVILVVSYVGAMHFVNHDLAARAAGLARQEALAKAFNRSRMPCFAAAVTTAIGFGSLAMIPIPATRQFGLFTAAGVLLAYVVTMTLVPLLLSTLRDVPGTIIARFRRGRTERRLKAYVHAVSARPGTAAAAVLLVLVASVVGIASIRVETDLIGALWESADLARATRYIDRHLTGVNSLEILVRDVPSTDPDAIDRVAAFERDVRSLPGVRTVTGLPDLYARVNRAFHEGDDAFEKLPRGQRAAQDLQDFRALLDQEAGAELKRFVSEDTATLRLAARVTALGTADSQALFEGIREAAGRAGLDRVDLTGNFVLLSDMSTRLVRSQVRGLALALLLISIAMAVQLRSPRLGLLATIPSAVAITMIYGLMGWAGIPLSVPTAMIACVAVGMTVDNTIHLLAGYRAELRRSADHAAALDAMVDRSGRAVTFASTTLALGFWVGVFSSFRPSFHFAVLTGTVLLLGLLAALTLLPLSLRLVRPVGMSGTRRAAVVLAVLAVALLAPGSPAEEPLVLKDQFGEENGPAAYAGRNVVLIYGQPKALRRMKSWEVALEKAAGRQLEVLRAVDGTSVKETKTVEEAGARLRRAVPDDISILLDWDRLLGERYEIPTEGEVAVVLLDHAGVACTLETGPVEDAARDRVLERLATIDESGSCP